MPSTAKLQDKKPALKAVEPAAPPPPKTHNQPDRETFHYYIGVIDREDEKVKAAQKARKDLRRKASDAGISLEVLDLVRRKRDKEQETAGGWMQNLLQAFKWLGMMPAVQLELFEDKPADRTKEAIAEQEGYVDGLEGKGGLGDRYDGSNDLGQARLRGWHRGQEVVRKRFAELNAAANGTGAPPA